LEPFEFQPEFECEEWGLVVKNIDKNIFRIQNLPDYNGVLVSAVKSGESAEKAGLQAGDIIRSINKRKIANLNEYKTVYNTILESQDEFVFFESMRNGASYFSAIQIKK
jgi:C-terminal processing protease CtpA/Prc